MHSAICQVGVLRGARWAAPLLCALSFTPCIEQLASSTGFDYITHHTLCAALMQHHAVPAALRHRAGEPLGGRDVLAGAHALPLPHL